MRRRMGFFGLALFRAALVLPGNGLAAQRAGERSPERGPGLAGPGVDQGRYGQSWEQSAALFRGAVVSRVFNSAEYTRAVVGNTF